MRIFKASVSALLLGLAITGCGPGDTPAEEPTASAEPPPADCCNCDYAATAIYPGNEEFQCSFAYPAHWEARYIPSENAVDVRAPRCAQRCKGARIMSFSIGPSDNTNAEYREQEWRKRAEIVGENTCGGRDGPIIRAGDTGPGSRSGMLIFHAGNFDGKAYDARVQFSCPNVGEWQKLEQLFLESLDDRHPTGT
ncbi:hypothetical protein FV139_09485 [Parahaliea maris]|uniref:Lipoprotein n=1 Tax=Parahaliea maris TaxID=2716870 RepID=A0A5C8ZZD5_9GAMM|nr:hypothetical protein [Parahaliea maris]TXS93856.1 hypothetical protein FV139_09485 [Parahaliea maris]